MNDELLLLNKARSLDPEALAQIHDQYYVPLFRYIAFRVSNHEAAEDLTSEVFTRLLSALRDHTAPSQTLRGWLYSVASRVVKDYYRKHYRQKMSELDENLASKKLSPAEIVEKMLTHQELRLAMQNLTEDQQNVIAFRYGSEMTIREVAEKMGKSEGSIKMLQARAIAALARNMQEAGME